MKATYIFTLMLVFGLSAFSCSKDDENKANPANITTPAAKLTDNEKSDLLLMREEEKLARDVYLYAYDLYGMNIFNNISGSEERHMDHILDLLITYEVDDPAFDERGKFNHPELQKLYDELTARCNLSLLDALMVGATIEDLDIFDLEKMHGKNSEIRYPCSLREVALRIPKPHSSLLKSN